MYEIRFVSARVKRNHIKLLKILSKVVKDRLRERLESYPYPNPHYHGEQKFPSKVEQKGILYCYEVTGGDRILYDVDEVEKIVIIHFAGNHDEEIQFFRKYS